MDFRILLVFAPILLALGWAGYNIGRAALGQIQSAIRQYKQNTST
ncbi:photosystem II protein Y [Synechococcus sp. AH-601-B19]|nr:photosystem II protein Y [Synechococcus sp. AH-601-B19]